MLYLTDTILDKAESQDIISKIMISDRWIDGNSTTTYTDKNIKKNLQLSGKYLPVETDSIKEKIMNNANIEGFSAPYSQCFARKDWRWNALQAAYRYSYH
jgi:predicted 2-oxoglutarate/Fe(II)-dependent dioxygenase YbiX